MNSLSIEQLEALIAVRRLGDECDNLPRDNLPRDEAAMNTVTVNQGESPKAVGPTVYVPVNVCGVPVEAMLDTGAQSTIISRELLHEIVRHLRTEDKPLPELKTPSARLYGKDGVEGGREIVITAQIDVDIAVDGESVCVPVFVQPGSTQPLLLGMNAIPALRFALLRPNGQSLIARSNPDPEISIVRLVKGVIVPSLKGSIVRVKVDNVHALPGGSVLFEPSNDQLEPKGLYSHESLNYYD